jgi:hypothetical protein
MIPRRAELIAITISITISITMASTVSICVSAAEIHVMYNWNESEPFFIKGESESEPRGVIPQILREIFDSDTDTLVFHSLPRRRAILSINIHEYPNLILYSYRTIYESIYFQYHQNTLLSHALFPIDCQLVFLRSSRHLSDFDRNIEPHSIAVPAYLSTEGWEFIVGTQESIRVNTHTPQSGLKMVLSRRADFYMNNNYTLAWAINDIGADPSTLVSRRCNGTSKDDVVFMMSTTMAENYLDYINQQIARLKKEGRIRSILMPYLHVGPHHNSGANE